MRARLILDLEVEEATALDMAVKKILAWVNKFYRHLGLKDKPLYEILK